MNYLLTFIHHKMRVSLIILLIVGLNALFVDCLITKDYQFVRGRRFGSSLRRQNDENSIPEKWFIQRLDHFDEALTKTWKQVLLFAFFNMKLNDLLCK